MTRDPRKEPRPGDVVVVRYLGAEDRREVVSVGEIALTYRVPAERGPKWTTVGAWQSWAQFGDCEVTK